MLDKSYFAQKLKYVENCHGREYTPEQTEIIYDKIKYIDRATIDKVADVLSDETYLPKPGKWLRVALEIRPADTTGKGRCETVVICSCGASMSILDTQLSDESISGFVCPNRYYDKCNKTYSRGFVLSMREKYGRDIFVDEIKVKL
jgi:hypothetical protein